MINAPWVEGVPFVAIAICNCGQRNFQALPKIESHRAAVALHLAYYNFCQLHGSLRVTPAMEVRITDHVWKVSELLA